MISFVIPSYNQVQYLPDAIDSILSQLNPVWDELIIVDDGSTDRSLEVAKKYELDNDELNPAIKVISQVNKGLASARNTGIMNAKEEWIWPLDADDILKDGAIKKMKEVIMTTPGADIVAPSFKTFGTSNQEIILMKDPKLKDFKLGNKIPYFSAIKKSKLLEVGGYSPRMTFGYEDLHLWINLLVRGAKIETIPEALVLYRTKPQSMYTDALSHHAQLLVQINKDFPEVKLEF